VSGRRRWILGLAFLVAGFTTGALLLRRAAEPEAPIKPTRLFEQVFTHVKRFGVDSLGESELYKRTADGLLGQLEDEYATLLPAGSDLGLAERADVGGLGMLLSTRDGRVAVLSVLPGSPADLAGVAAGDQVLEAGTVPLDAERRDQVLAALDGPPGTSLEIRVRRPGLGVLGFTLKRGDGVRRSGDARVQARRAHRVRSGTIAGSWRAALSASVKLRVSPARAWGALILDLRGASQGSLDEAIRLADFLLEPGAGVVEVRGRGNDAKRVGDDAPQDRRVAALPVVALVDSGTADAAEVVAGALQDNDRALLLGEPTFGRGLTPETFPLADRMTIRISTGRWYTPAGRQIQRDTAASDTLEKRPQVPTAGGRRVYAGGGIVPDSLIHRDTLTTAQLLLVRAIGSEWSKWRGVVRTFATTLARELPAGADPVITTAHRARLHAELEKEGVSIANDVWQGGSDVIDRVLGDEIVRTGSGEDALVRRRVKRDRLVLKASELLKTATTPTSIVLGK
jgi:carboxyl-terminal processing protease